MPLKGLCRVPHSLIPYYEPARKARCSVAGCFVVRDNGLPVYRRRAGKSLGVMGHGDARSQNFMYKGLGFRV